MDLVICALVLVIVGVFFLRSLQKERKPDSRVSNPGDSPLQPPLDTFPSLDQRHGEGTEERLKNKLMQYAQQQNEDWREKAGFAVDPESYANQVIMCKRKAEAIPYKYRYQPPVILLAQPRATTEIETQGRSWLGGLPSLGDQPWPRSRDGSPMHPVAQIDLTELADIDTPEGFPKTGSLAFFLDLTAWPYSGAVTHVPQTDGHVTQPISALPRLARRSEGLGTETGSYALPGYTPQNAPRTFPRWPIRLVPLDVDEETDENSDPAAEEIWKMLPETRSTYYLVASRYKDSCPGIMTPTKWHTAQKFANDVTLSREWIPQNIRELRKLVETPTTWQDQALAERIKALDALKPEEDESPEAFGKRKDALRQRLDAQRDRYETVRAQEVANLEFICTNARAFVAFEEELAAWAFAQDQWADMEAHDVSRLKSDLARVQEDYLDKTPGLHLFMHKRPSLEDYLSQTLLDMIRGPRAVYEQLPQQIRDDFDRKALFMRWHDRHKMFGGYPTCHALERREGDYLLLSLGDDYLEGWSWGHGPATFYITPEDLEQQRWGNVRVDVGFQ